jgi:hypothetical protein
MTIAAASAPVTPEAVGIREPAEWAREIRACAQIVNKMPGSANRTHSTFSGILGSGSGLS